MIKKLFIPLICLPLQYAPLYAIWHEALLEYTVTEMTPSGAPILDDNGNILYRIADDSGPSAVTNSSNSLSLLRAKSTYITNPPETTPGGAPVIADYLLAATIKYASGTWENSEVFLDLLLTQNMQIKIAYPDTARAAVRLAEKNLSTWQFTTVSTTPGAFSFLAVAEKNSGGCAVAYTLKDGSALYLSENTLGTWNESTIDSSTIPNYFRGVDLVFLSDQPLIFAYRNEVAYLAVYSDEAIPSYYETLVNPIAIRSAAIVTWPSPSPGAYSQVLQRNDDLTVEEGWETIESRSVTLNTPDNEYETLVEIEGTSGFFRVLDIFEY